MNLYLIVQVRRGVISSVPMRRSSAEGSLSASDRQLFDPGIAETEGDDLSSRD
jgi:hypothetical protein